MKSYFRWLLVGLVIAVLTACSGGKGNVDNNTTTPISQKSTITGYAEDDPIPNAEVRVTDKDNNIVAQATADANGKYSLEGKFEEGKVYMLESKGKIADKNVTLHSIFKFSNDTVINANPITELKYQLVQSGKSLDEAEKLIRDYFSIISGEKLERNRFDVNGALAVSMADLAKLYDGVLPIDAIAKIKEDILRNADLAIEDREYAYKDSLQLNLQLTASSSSLKVGKNVTVTLTGVDDLNKNYYIKWVGIPNDNNESTLSKTFTIDEPRDVIVAVNLYIKDDTNSSNNILLKSVSTKVNFYKVEEPVSVDINGTDANISVASDVKLNIPASASSSVSQIKYSEVTTNSSDYLKVFTLEPSGTVFSEPMEIRIKYDPSQVYDPRLLTIKRVSDNGKEEILKVKEIDYANSELIFETEHFSRFIIEKDVAIGEAFGRYVRFRFGEKTSFEKWDERGVSSIVSINNIAVKENSPYHYLMESLNFYCEKNNIDNGQCQRWLVYLNNRENAEKIAYSYKNFFNLTNGIGATNYDIFQNNYFIWGLAKKLYEFPGEKVNFFGNRPKDAYEYIHKLMHSDSLDGNVRKYNFFSYTSSAIKSASFANLLQFNIPNVKIISNLNKVASLSSNIYKDLNNNEYRTKTYLISKRVGELVFKEILGQSNISKLLLNPAYLKLFAFQLDLMDTFEEAKFKLAYQKAKTDSSFNFDRYFYIVTNDTSDTFISGKLPRYSIKLKNNGLAILEIDGKEIDKDMALQMLNGIINLNRGNDKEKAISYVTNFYITLKNYSKIYFDDSYNKEILIATKLEGAKVALSILRRAGKVSASDLESNKQAKLNKLKKFLLKNKLQKRSLRKVETAENDIVSVPVLDNFDKFLEQIKINIPETKWDNIEVKKVSLSVDKYAIESEASTSTTMMTFNVTNFVGNSYFSKQNIAKDGFNLANEKYSQNLASIFTDLDASDFQDSFVVVKAKILIKLNGIDRVISKEYQFINYLDSDNELVTDPEYGKLTSAIKDAVTGEPIVDARITLLPIDITNNTDENGNYSFSKLPPNTYNVRVSKEGYKTETIYGVTLEDGEVKNIEILLAIDDEHASSLGGADITLKDAINGNIITNGYIKVREGQNNKTGEVLKELTNSGNSDIHIDMNASTYTVEVGANGYSKSFNTITIIGDTNNTYEFSVSPILAEDQVRVVLTWGENPNDLDSHLVRLSDNNVDYHVYYSNMRPANADANLDTDDTSSYGPETITISGLSNASTYRYYVHDYSNGSNHNDEIFKASGAKVEVYYGDQSKTFYVPNENGNVWKVFEIVNGEIIPCTTGCMFGVNGSEDSNIGLRKLDRNALDKRYFRNLPAK